MNLTFDEDLLQISSFKVIVSNSGSLSVVRSTSSYFCPLVWFRFDRNSWQIHNLHLPVGKTLLPFFFLVGLLLHLGDDGMFDEVWDGYSAASAGFPQVVGGLT